MSNKVKPIPTGYHTVQVYMIVRDAAKAIDFWKKVFGAEERGRMPGPGGKLMHAELKIGDSIIMLSDEMPDWGSKSPQTLGGCHASPFIYVENVDAVWKRALDAGCTVKQPLQDQFWGDRFGQITDPFGYTWGMATHIEDVPPEEMPKRAQAAMAQMGPPPSQK
jgi:PhnB protein